MKSFLKIKVLSLGAEIGLIRREEQRHLKQRRWCDRVLKGRINNPTKAEDVQKQQWAADANYLGLRQHRLALRPEARAANIAYGFLRGRTYVQVENKVYNPPNWTVVIRLIERYGELPKGYDAKFQIEAWSKRS